MALQKQAVDINFSKGLDTKSDPYQVAIGSFLRLQNSVFTTAGRLTKRNGYAEITELPQSASFLTTFDGNLTAVGSSLQAYIKGSNTWVNKGNLQPISLSTLSLIRSNTNQTQVDAVKSVNNFVCTAYTDTGSGSTKYMYALADSVTGQNVLAPAVIPASGTITIAPKVFLLGSYFVIVFGTATTLQYVYINTVNPAAPVASTSISTQYTPDTRGNFDGVVSNNNLYLAWNGSDGGTAIRATYIDSRLQQHNTVVVTGYKSSIMSVSADESGSTPNIYITFWNATNSNGYTMVRSATLASILVPTQVITTTAVTNLTAVTVDNLQTIYYEVTNAYTYDSSIPTNYISEVTCTNTGTVGSPSVLARSVGLASKAFQVNGISYLMAVYVSPTQPTYFLLNQSGQVVSRLAYSNAGGYRTTGLPNITIEGDEVSLAYQYKDLLVPINKDQNATSSTSVYSQTGLNFVTFTLGTIPFATEIGSNLNITGGFLWSYDGYSPVEQNFFLWPDSVEVTTSGSGGLVTAQEYFYQALYEWTDNQGNIQRSAPSIPVSITTTGATSTNTIKVPTLRLTYKIANPVKIVIYRWSVAQQEYFQVTSITSPKLNDPAVDYITFTDTQADSAILGNSLIYTTGGVIENIGAPSFNALTLFDSRLWGIDAEDPNLLWYSKQVIEATPVEMSDLLTLYTAPSTSAQGSTGPSKCLAPMDDKLIVFKRDAMYFINGNGPDNAGANSQYSQPVFITSTVGCSNQASIVFMQDGLMFQSDKGIWLLGRGLQTEYIGATVEQFTDGATVLSAVNVPATTQVRFTLDTGITLMYDYFYHQWGTFSNINATSSTLYENLHTYINTRGSVFQETPDIYLDGSAPVLQSFTTSWIAAAGLQGYQRAYWLQLLGTYLSPHKLNIQVAYDFENAPSQSTLITPQNVPETWGSDQLWGSNGVWGGMTNVEDEQLFFEQQKCTSFQLLIDEVYDPEFGSMAGAGLTLSGLSLTIGIKKSYKPTAAVNQHG